MAMKTSGKCSRKLSKDELFRGVMLTIDLKQKAKKFIINLRKL
jgi:hypothetical protein